MRVSQLVAWVVFAIISLALVGVAGGLIGYAGMHVFNGFDVPAQDIGRSLLDSVCYTVVAMAVFEVAKYILVEEVIDPAQMRHTGEARRSITKFISTIIIAVFLETLVAVFQASKSDDLS